MAVVFNGENVGIAVPIARQDRLQWKCDNMKSLYMEFRDYTGTSLDEVLTGLDTSQVTNMYGTFYNNSALVGVPTLNTESVTSMLFMFYGCRRLSSVSFSDTSKVTDMSSLFYQCSSLTQCPELDTSSVTNMTSMFSYSGVKSVNLSNTSNVTNMSSMFNQSQVEEVNFSDTSNVTQFGQMFTNCSTIKSVQTLNLIKQNSQQTLFTSSCRLLETLILKNIRWNIQIGSGSSWGHLLSVDSLINTIKELWDWSSLTSSRTLTMGTANKAKLANVYVKLVDITDEMRAEDEYIDNKKPCVVCESTDEGAMLIEEYAVLKNWALA